MELLDRLVKDKTNQTIRDKTLSRYLTKIAQLSGYLVRASDSQPSNQVMWRKMARVTDVEL